MAVILSFISAYNPKSKLEAYMLPNGKDSVKGVFTNEVPLKYLLNQVRAEYEKKLKDSENKKSEESNPEGKKEKIKVLFIVSKSVFVDKVNPNGPDRSLITQYEYYLNFIKDYVESWTSSPFEVETDYIPYDFCEENGKIVSVSSGDEIANNIYHGISQKTENERNIYIDYTGGFRDVAYLVVTLIQYFKIKDAECKSIVYSQFGNQEEGNSLKEINHIYKINEIIQGAEDFILTGNISRLKKFFKSYEKINELIPDILNSIDAFTKAISIGRLDKIDEYKEKVKTSISRYDGEGVDADLHVNIFTLLFDTIKKSLYIDSENWGYPEIVEWCIDHGYIQQAFTIYVEKIPQIYLDAGIEGELPETLSDATMGGSLESTKFYKDYWDSISGQKEKAFADKLLREFRIDNSPSYERFCICDFERTTIFSAEEKECLKRLEKVISSYNPSRDFTAFGFEKQAKITAINPTKERERLFNQMMSNAKKLAFYLMNNGETYEFEKKSGTTTEEKKMRVIDAVAQQNNNLASTMRIYLGIKIMRNHMNHAAGDNKPKDAEIVRCILEKETGQVYGDVFDYDCAVALMKKGIEITKGIRDDKIELLA